MKKFIFFACVYASLSCTFRVAVTGQNLNPHPNYVVIGAFAQHKNAIRFTKDANQHDFSAQFEMNPNRNLYYVFVLATDDREYAFAEALKLRTETKYFDTWVFSGPLGEAALTTNGSEVQDLNPVTGQELETVNAREQAAFAEGNAEIEPQRPERGTSQQRTAEQTDATTGQTGHSRDNAIDQRTLYQRDNAAKPGKKGQNTSQQGATAKNNERLEVNGNATRSQQGEMAKNNEQLKENENATGSPVNNQKKASSPSNQTEVSGPGVVSKSETVERPAPPREFPKKVNTAPLTAEEVVGKDFFFQLYRADNKEWVEGEVDAIDFERSRKMATYPANTPVKVTLPSGKSKQISFICQVFGYRKQQIEFDPADPSPDFFLDEKGNLIVPFELVRLQKGDIAIMYNVFFFKDAAVMRPESRYEVNNLLELLKENPSYNIRIHGHTNGNAGGKIIRMDKSENFYSLSNTKQGFGSAKALSEERALVIKQFLVSSGIPEERMQIKAWGGKKPIHDKNSVRAVENVRVEIEILSD